jgi:hypothetical protein
MNATTRDKAQQARREANRRFRENAGEGHPHDDLLPHLGKLWCECGDGPFTQATWDDHRMALLGELPITRREIELLDELDNPRTKAPRREEIESEFAAIERESLVR